MILSRASNYCCMLYLLIIKTWARLDNETLGSLVQNIPELWSKHQHFTNVEIWIRVNENISLNLFSGGLWLNKTSTLSGRISTFLLLTQSEEKSLLCSLTSLKRLPIMQFITLICTAMSMCLIHSLQLTASDVKRYLDSVPSGSVFLIVILTNRLCKCPSVFFYSASDTNRNWHVESSDLHIQNETEIWK